MEIDVKALELIPDEVAGMVPKCKPTCSITCSQTCGGTPTCQVTGN